MEIHKKEFLQYQMGKSIGGKVKHLITILCTSAIIFFCGSCHNKQTIESVLERTKSNDFIAVKYIGKSPLVQLINMPNFTEKQSVFTLKEDCKVQIYAVGELLFNIKDEDKRYYLKSDDIDLYFKVKHEASLPSDDFFIVKHFNISMANDKKDLEKAGLTVKWYKEEGYYLSQISIPWKILNIRKPGVGVSIPFDVSIGDNDNNFMQEKKIAWNSSGDSMLINGSGYGDIFLSKTNGIGYPSKLIATRSTPAQDSIVEKEWSTIQKHVIDNVIFGRIKDSLDLSATIQSAWDNKFLYLLVRVTDQKLRRIFYNRKEEHKIFVDYGWIENSKGDTLWEMLAENSRYAGGAYKNQKIDTVLELRKGTYVAKYITDESHSYNQWNDLPPKTPFYGIVIYKVFK
jgi:hypothetical protein